VLTPLKGLGNFIKNAHGESPVSVEFYRGMQATPPQPGFHNTVHDAIPETLPPQGNGFGMTQLRFVFAVSEVKNA
jgi:hypothetical protein